jgi:hypothetical protein
MAKSQSKRRGWDDLSLLFRLRLTVAVVALVRSSAFNLSFNLSTYSMEYGYLHSRFSPRNDVLPGTVGHVWGSGGALFVVE